MSIHQMDHMTARVACFARAYHTRHSDTPVFSDPLAERMLTPGEYDAISRHMAAGIQYFAPSFRGTPEEALAYIVNRQLAPSVLARSAFCQRAMRSAVSLGCGQIVIFACGYDTFPLRAEDPSLTVYELDRPEMIADRRQRIACQGLAPTCRVISIGCDLSRPGWTDSLTSAGFSSTRSSFSSLLGISYYLTKDEFQSLVAGISSVSCEGSAICFDYPTSEGGRESAVTRELAAAAGESMKALYSHGEMESLLSGEGFLISGHLNADEATETFFSGSGMTAPLGVGYCLAVKRRGILQP